MSCSNLDLAKLALAVIETEAQAVSQLAQRINEDFVKACQLLLACQGRIVVIGMGKSGHIGSKIAATLASTGSPAFFVHPAEASHGDLGMITKDDAVIAISYSGQTEELLTLLPALALQGTPVISLTGNPNSSLAQHAAVNLDISVEHEACPLGLAPTTSTTCSLVMGDALAIALLKSRGFSEADFARSHPGGSLGKRLLLRVSDLMQQGEELPIVSDNALLSEALVEMTAKKRGMALVVNQQQQPIGIFTDGDLRRALTQQEHILQKPVTELMTKQFKSIEQNELAASALQLMEQHKITSLVVFDQQQWLGIIHMHDILQAGI